MSFEEFQKDIKTQDAVIRNFEIIGEAANRLPEEIRSLYHGIEWAKIVGFRNVLIREYFGVKLETVWSALWRKCLISKSRPRQFSATNLDVHDRPTLRVAAGAGAPTDTRDAPRIDRRGRRSPPNLSS